MKYLSIIILSCVCFFGVTHGVAHAELRENDISATVTPEIPGPNEDIQFLFSSFSLDINRVMFVWKVDGKTELSGIGKTNFMTKSGPVGSKKTITVTLNYQGDSLTKTFVIQPTSLDLLWEAVDTYRPPFYKGKTLPGSEAKIKIVAQPDMKGVAGKQVSASNMLFFWKRNYTTAQAASGYAKNSFTFKHNYLNKNEIVSVIGTDFESGKSASATFSLKLSNPKILFYGVTSDLGIWFNSALSNNQALSSLVTQIFAAPYSFAPREAKSGEFSFAWSINGVSATANTIRNMITAGSGVSSIGLRIESNPRLFQTAESRINFSK